MNPLHGTWVVVPVRGFAQGKSRLAATLEPAQRARLNRELFARTLAAVTAACGRAERCIVVSPDRDVRHHATALGAAAIDEPAVCAREGGVEAGLNAALATGAQVAARRGALRVLLLAADLPGIGADPIARFAAAADEGAAAIAPDRHRRGTNALLLPAGAEAALRFGANSLAAHRAAFAALGIALREWDDPALAFDLDTPEDWACEERRVLVGDL